MGRGRQALFVAALVAGAAACSKSVAVSVNVVTVGCVGSPDPFNQDGGVGQTVQFLQFDVTVDGGSVFSQPSPVGSQTLMIPQVPLGTAEINVKGLTSNTPTATIVSEGNSGPFVIPGDGSVSQLSVTVFMRPTNAFSFTNNGTTPGKCTTMMSPRAYHSQALLPDGKVLIYGGLQYLADPSSQVRAVDWTLALAMPPMVVPNTQYWATAEIYDPQTGEFTDAGSIPPSNGAPNKRAFAQLVPYSNGGALVVGGEYATNSDPLAVPAINGSAFSPNSNPTWSATRTASPHAHGCLTQDTSGHALVAGGYSQLPADVQDQAPTVLTTSLQAEFIDPAAWLSNEPLPPPPKAVPDINLPSNNVPIAISRADQACSGMDGLSSFFGGLALEIGGVFMDDAGLSATIDQDYVIYQYQLATVDAGGNFAPYTTPNPVDGGLPIVLGNTLTAPRARAKAAAMIVTEPSADRTSTVLGDAVLVTGGITCTPDGLSATCTPPYLANANQGQLANPPFTYFLQDGGNDVGMSTELIAFPPGPNGNSVDPGSLTANMAIERIDHCAVALPDGRVVVLGGLGGANAGSFGTNNSAEVFSDNPLGATLPSVQSATVPNGLLTPRAGMACTLMKDGSILVTGGFQTTGPLQANNSQQVETLNTAEIYRPLPLAGADGG